jgi:hypothetical protein
MVRTSTGSDIPDPPQAPGEVAEERVPEAFTVFLTMGEKRRLLSALRHRHRNIRTALLQWVEEMEQRAAEGGA